MNLLNMVKRMPYPIPTAVGVLLIILPEPTFIADIIGYALIKYDVERRRMKN